MTPTLPDQDTDPSGRAAQLASARAETEYAWDRPEGIAMTKSVPKRLGFPLGVIAKVAEAEAALFANRAAVRVTQGLHAPDPNAPSTIATCTALFELISLPPIGKLWTSESSKIDQAFAWQRLAGANPFTLRRIDRVPDHFAVDAALFARAIPGDSLDAARAEGRLFLADYAVLDGLPAGVTATGAPRWFSAPLALFVRTSAGLMPVAIQCTQTPSGAALTPSDGAAWEMARLVVQVADANVEESFQHLGRAHFLIEAFALAMERQLSDRHPLNLLLAPHFFGTLAINGAARDKLVVKGGQLDQLLAPSLEGSLTLVRKGITSFRLDECTFEGDLRVRGVLDRDALPEYPFRDDGALIARAIDAFALEYLAIAYETDARVASDPELRAFVGELRSNEGGRLGGVPERVETLSDLARLVSFVVFTTSAHHAALNYTQADFMGWAPNMPTAAFAKPPTSRGGDSDSMWKSALPPQGLASAQLEFMWQQSQIRDNRLGDYGAGHFEDPRVTAPLARFGAALEAAQAAIEERERSRLLPYPYLLPSNLTASIHI